MRLLAEKRQGRPRDLSTSVEVWLVFDLHGQVQAVAPGQGNRLVRRRLKESASSRRGRAMTKGKREDTSRAEEAGYPAHRLTTLLRVEMYPDGRKHHDVESSAACHETVETREGVVDPFNVGQWV